MVSFCLHIAGLFSAGVAIGYLLKRLFFHD
jgi:hypothetical protein